MIAAIAAIAGARLRFEEARGSSVGIGRPLAVLVGRGSAGFSGATAAAQTATWLRV